MSDAYTISGQCHCGSVQFRASLVDGLNTARRCTCSYCRMRGAVVVSVALDGIEITRGINVLTEYRFNTATAKHYFCSVCGIYTHHQRRSNANQFGVNAACLQSVSPFDFERLPVVDGVNHPSDTKTGGGIIGHLLFIAQDTGG